MKLDEKLTKALDKLIDAIGNDYERWTIASYKASGYDMDRGEAKIEEFKAALEVKVGRKFIKIISFVRKFCIASKVKFFYIFIKYIINFFIFF